MQLLTNWCAICAGALFVEGGRTAVLSYFVANYKFPAKVPTWGSYSGILAGSSENWWICKSMSATRRHPRRWTTCSHSALLVAYFLLIKFPSSSGRLWEDHCHQLLHARRCHNACRLLRKRMEGAAEALSVQLSTVALASNILLRLDDLQIQLG